ncbi:MAG: hypothetical protein R3B09_01775 [Nannocystaceae bacterium]
MRISTSLLLLLLVPACGLAALSDYHDALDGQGTESGSTTTGDDDTTTTWPGPISTVTTSPPTQTEGDASTSSDASTAIDTDDTTADTSVDTSEGTSTGSEDNAPPYVHWITATPEKVTKAGPVTIKAVFSEDVVEIDLYADDEHLATFTPAELPYAHLIASSAANGHRDFWIRVRDPEGLEADSLPAGVDVALPESGTSVWKLIGSDPQWAEARAITPLASGGVAVGGFLAKNGSPSAIIRFYNADKALLSNVAPVSGESLVTGLAATPKGDLVAVGVVNDGGLRPWLVGLSDGGNYIFAPVYGNVGETATGVDVAEDGSIYVSGYVETEGQGKFDAMLWAYNPTGGPRWSRQWDGPDLLTPGSRRDQAHAVAVLADGSVATAGETTIQDPNDLKLKYSRALVLHYAASDKLLGSWDAGDSPAKHTAARAIAADAEGLLVGGWSSGDPAISTKPLTLRLATPSLEPTWVREELTGNLGFEAVEGLGRLPEGAVVITATIQGSGNTDLLVRAIDSLQGVAMWDYTLATAADERAHALRLGDYGAIYYAGATGTSKIIAGELAP